MHMISDEQFNDFLKFIDTNSSTQEFAHDCLGSIENLSKKHHWLAIAKTLHLTDGQQELVCTRLPWKKDVPCTFKILCMECPFLYKREKYADIKKGI